MTPDKTHAGFTDAQWKKIKPYIKARQEVAQAATLLRSAKNHLPVKERQIRQWLTTMSTEANAIDAHIKEARRAIEV